MRPRGAIGGNGGIGSNAGAVGVDTADYLRSAVIFK